MAIKMPFVAPNLSVFAYGVRSEEKEEAFSILLFLELGPSMDHKTLLKCCLYTCQAVGRV